MSKKTVQITILAAALAVASTATFTTMVNPKSQRTGEKTAQSNPAPICPPFCGGDEPPPNNGGGNGGN